MLKLTFDILLDELKYHYTIHLQNNKKPMFEWAKLLPLKNVRPSSQYLNVCLLSEAMECPYKEKGKYYLCLRDRIADSLETEELLNDMVIINENINLFELFNHVQEVFIKMNNWTVQMQESIVNNKGIQDLIDLSEPILKNHISVLDATFKLLAHTKNIECNDPIISDLLHLGYHPEIMIKKLKMFRHIEHYKQSEEILIDKTLNISKYVALEKAFNYNNTYSIQVVMLCCQRDFSECQFDLFRILIDHVRIYVDRKYLNKDIYNMYATLIQDLIQNGKLFRKESVMERAKYVNIPYSAYFNLFVISFDDAENIPLNRVMQELSERLTTSKVIMYGQSIVLVNIYNDKNVDEYCEQKISKIKDIIINHSAYGGVSSCFYNLLQLQIAYEQAISAISLGKKKAVENLLSHHFNDKENILNHSIFRFEDIYIDYIIDLCEEKNFEILEMSNCIQILKNIDDYDRKHNTRYMKILFIYLTNERNATQAAKKLYMHRNNIIYHVNRIKELTGINLDDYEQRLKIIIAFKIFEQIK